MDLISIIALLLLVFILILCSIEDILTMKVSNYSIISVVIIACAFFFQLTQYENIVIKSIYIISTIILVLTIGYLGNELYKLNIYGGADIKLIMALSPLILHMKITGAFFLIWFFGINPFMQLSLRKSAIAIGDKKKIPFVPYISAVFIVMLSLYLIYN